MSIVKYLSFSGEAEVMGFVRPFQFAEGQLAIEGLTLEEAKVALDLLAAGKLRVSSLPDQPAAATPAPTPPAPTPVKAPANFTELVQAMPQATKDAMAGAAIGAAPPAALAKVQKAAPVTPVTIAASVGETNVVLSDAPPEIHPDLLTATKIAQVVAFLVKGGICAETIEALLPECNRIKPYVPVLRPVAEMGDRLKRTLEMLADPAKRAVLGLPARA